MIIKTAYKPIKSSSTFISSNIKVTFAHECFNNNNIIIYYKSRPKYKSKIYGSKVTPAFAFTLNPSSERDIHN